MNPMRRLIEAARPPKLSYEEQQARLLQQAKQSASQLYAQTQTVIATANHSDHQLRQWGKTWTTELRTVIQKVHKTYLDDAKEELAYDLESNPNAVLRPVSFLESVNEGLLRWWAEKRDRIEWADARYRLEEYMDAHNKTEASDDMSRLDAEERMLRDIQYLDGGFRTLESMAKTVTAMASYLDVENRHSNGGWSHPGTAVTEIITQGIPVILMICKTIEKHT